MSENIPYIIAEDGYYYVAYKEKVKVPEIVVSSKGIANGLSEEYNDGWDFGPDSYDPNSTASIPYTQTSGIQEAHLYRVSLAYLYPGEPWSFVPKVVLLSGTFICNSDIIVYPNNNGVLGATTTMIFEGEGRNSISQVIFQGNAKYGFDYSGATAGTNIHLQSINLRGGDTALTSLINANLPVSGGNYITLNDVQLASGSGTLANGVMISGIGYIFMIDFASEISPTTTNFINISGGATGDKWLNIIGLRGASNTININASLSNAHFDLKSSMNFNITGSGQIAHLVITGTTNGTITNAGTIHTLDINGTLLTHSPFISNSGTINKLFIRGLLSPQASSGNLINNTGTIGYFRNDAYVIPNGTYVTTFEVTPTISTNPPATGTVYQNTNPYDIEIDLPVYASTSGTAGYVTVAKGSTDTPTAIANQYVSGDTSSTSTQIIRLRVPARWYYEFTASGVTFGTASVFTD